MKAVEFDFSQKIKSFCVPRNKFLFNYKLKMLQISQQERKQRFDKRQLCNLLVQTKAENIEKTFMKYRKVV